MERDPGNVHPYNKIWAILSVDKNGNEGIIGIDGPFGPMQAITGSKKVLWRIVEGLRNEPLGDKKLVLAEFTRTSTEPLKER